ncbi:hypothetical protein [Caballeronia sp. Sq4a]|nr:hypothetical protein [Caballeronia sp. Sq4a]
MTLASCGGKQKRAALSIGAARDLQVLPFNGRQRSVQHDVS